MLCDHPPTPSVNALPFLGLVCAGYPHPSADNAVIVEHLDHFIELLFDISLEFLVTDRKSGEQIL